MPGYVHYCVFCTHRAPAASATMIEPTCPACGCVLRAAADDEFAAIEATLAQTGQRRPSPMDGAGPLAVLTAGPLLLPLVGVQVRDIVLAVPVVFLVFATAKALAAARRDGEPARAWRLYAAGTGIAALAAASAIVLALLGWSPRPAAHLGALASLALLLAVGTHLAPHLGRARRERLLDAAGLLVLVGSAGIYFVVVPAFARGDPVLTVAFLADLVAFTLAGLLVAAGRRRSDLQVAGRVRLSLVAVMVADGLIAGAARHAEYAVAPLLALAGWSLAGAATVERPRGSRRQEDDRRPTTPERRWLAARVLLPTMQVAAFPALLAVAIARDGPAPWPIALFGGGFLVVLLIAFSRQAMLLVDHRRAVIEERSVRRAAQRRNEELEALTGLAATMTQTLEEEPVIEQALTVLHTAARASATALHVVEGDRRRLRASAGDWTGEHPWTDSAVTVDGTTQFARGGRHVTRVDVVARDHAIGWVTFLRPAQEPLAERDLSLLRLLVDQMAIAIQNARDYREKREQAVRDPLTGLYNRRHLFEALEREVQRAGRYGSSVALVLLDADDFKVINDTHGHAAGDEVLRGIAGAVLPLLRPADTFARIGGEEFALLLPETERTAALAVAERVRAAISRRPLAGGRVTVSAGVGACPEDSTNAAELMRRTDGALYWVKRNGKDRCAVVR